MSGKFPLVILVVLLLAQGLRCAPFYPGDERLRKPKDLFDGTQDVHMLSRKTLNHLITGLVGLLMNLNPDSRFQSYPRPQYYGY